jgi:hypothetical protein
MYREDYELSEQSFADLKKVTNLLKLQKQTINKFFKIFVEIDVEVRNYVEISEFLDYFPVGNTFFSRKCFCLFDAENTGNMSFIEFVLAIYAFCTMDYNGMLSYIFRWE